MNFFDRVIHFSIYNKLVIGFFTLGLIMWGVYSAANLPIDSQPDITNNQVQISTLATTFGAQEVGHTTVAFAAATVFAMEYRNKPLVPIIAYSAATLVGVSKLTENKHWFTDILVGAALGYLSGRQVVNNYHRYAKIKQPDKPNRKMQLSFNLQSFQGKLLPGLTYKF